MPGCACWCSFAWTLSQGGRTARYLSYFRPNISPTFADVLHLWSVASIGVFLAVLLASANVGEAIP